MQHVLAGVKVRALKCVPTDTLNHMYKGIFAGTSASLCAKC